MDRDTFYQSRRAASASPSVASRKATSIPNHRTASPPPPAITKKTRKIRSLFSSSSSGEHARIPARQRSVRFQDQCPSPLDGANSEPANGLSRKGSNEFKITQTSSKLAERIADLENKLSGSNAGTNTILHRASLKARPSTPYLNINVESMSSRVVGDANIYPSTLSSTVPSITNGDWSPASTTSTAATSFNSPGSSRYKRTTPEDCQNISKSISGGAEENLLPPIDEDNGRFLYIPVQEAPIEVEPSVATVENAAAAKIYMETHYSKLLYEPCSPRSMRRKRFERLMCENGLGHEQRLLGSKEWIRAESDHLRQERVLKATSLSRHLAKGISIAGFDVIRVLGKGSFGVVKLVTECHPRASNGDSRGENLSEGSKSDVPNFISNMDGTAKHNLPTGEPLRDVFAMKVIRKSEMLRACQEGHLRAERDFLVAAEGSRWVVPLIASLQDNTNLYLVMEYMIGGDFLGLLLREDVLDESVAR